MAGVTEDPQVVLSLSRLLARAFGARSVHDVSDAVVEHVQLAMPPMASDTAWMSHLRRRIAAAARDVCLAALPGGAPARPRNEPGLGPQEATDAMGECIESAAQQMDDARGPMDGRCLRAARDALIEAARGIPARAWGQEEHAAVREAETFGAPPCALFRLGGELLWVNAAMKQLCERAGTPVENVLKDAAPMAVQMAQSARALGGVADPGHNIAQLGALSAVHLRATLRAGRADSRSMMIEVVGSQARRETRLTPRELQVATMIARHGSYRVVAEETGISLDSVRTYVRRVYKKLGINSRSQLRARLIHEGLYADF